MVCAAFDYVAVDSYDEAVARLAADGDEAKILAGGQSLLPMLNLRLARPTVLIDINAADRREPSVAGGVLTLPALTRHRALLEHHLVRRHCPLLASAIAHVGNVRVRNRGTIGGSLAHADPTAEVGSCALVLDARVAIRGPRGKRTAAVRDLFVSYLTTILEPDEVITDVLVDVATPGQGASFHEMVRRTSDFAIVAVAAWVDLDETGGAARQVRLALAGVADRVVLADPGVLAGLVGSAGEQAELAGAAEYIAASVDPVTDVHASGDYRRRLVRVLAARALRDAFDDARGVAA